MSAYLYNSIPAVMHVYQVSLLPLCTLNDILFITIDPPLVSVAPPSLILNQSDAAVFTCNIFGIPRPTFTWSNGSTVLSSSSPSNTYTITNSTDTYNISAVLTILSVLRTDMGTYTCSASNGIANLIDSPEEDTAELFVQGKFQLSFTSCL